MAFAILVLLFSSCSKENEFEKTETQKTSDVTVKNGRLVFSSKKSLNESVELLSNKTDMEILNWQKQFQFTSLHYKKQNLLIKFL